MARIYYSISDTRALRYSNSGSEDSEYVNVKISEIIISNTAHYAESGSNEHV